MNKDDQIDNWVAIIKRKFRDGPPNGYILNWDEDRFEDDLIPITKPGEFANATDFNYAFCNSYRVYFPSADIESYAMLSMEISFIVDAFVLSWTQYTNFGRKGYPLPDLPSDLSGGVEQKIRDYLVHRGFREVGLEEYSLKIDGVCLELSEPDDIILGKCLFEDYFG